MKSDFDWPSGFRGEDVSRVWMPDEGRTARRRTMEAYLSYKLSGELKTKELYRRQHLSNYK